MLIGRKGDGNFAKRGDTGTVFYAQRLLKTVAAGSILAPDCCRPSRRLAGKIRTGLYPAKQSPRYTLDRPLTDEKLATSCNNFYSSARKSSPMGP
jgi:hypothetical protein